MFLTFMVNGKPVSVDVPPLKSLLRILREDCGLTGTKEGCGEGECGACAVHLQGKLVKACMVAACTLQGSHVVTIEGVSASGPTPLQQAFLEEGAVQCGFCTPGFVMASEYLLRCNPNPTEEEIRVGLGGNLCRCTGYGALLRGVRRAVEQGYIPPAFSEDTRGIAEKPLGYLWEEGVCLPENLEDALEILDRYGDQVVPLAGGTDLLPDLEKKVRSYPSKVMPLRNLRELQAMEFRQDEGCFAIGAGVSFARIREDSFVQSRLPMLQAMASKVGSVAIQNMASLGGNLATASAAGDSAPVLLALEAHVVLASSRGQRRIPLKEFYTAYRTTVREPSELLLQVLIPESSFGGVQKFCKVGGRQALTISRLSLAFRALPGEKENVFSEVRIALGSVTPYPVLLEKGGALFENVPLHKEGVERGAREIARGIQPRTDKAYRQRVIQKSICRFFEEILL